MVWLRGISFDIGWWPLPDDESDRTVLQGAVRRAKAQRQGRPPVKTDDVDDRTMFSIETAPKPAPSDGDDRTVFSVEPAPKPAPIEDEDRTVFSVELLERRDGPVASTVVAMSHEEPTVFTPQTVSPAPVVPPQMPSRIRPRDVLNLVEGPETAAARFDTPLLDAASPFLLRLSRYLSGRRDHPVAELHTGLAKDLARMDALAVGTDLDPDDLSVARYILAATADAAAPHPDPQNTLIHRTFGTFDRGDGLTVCLEHALSQDPPHTDLLHLGGVCLRLSGANQAPASRHLAAQISAALGADQKGSDLSAQWRPSPAPARQRRGARLHWALVVVPPLLVLGTVAAASLRQTAMSDAVRSEIEALVPVVPAASLTIGRDTPPRAAPVPVTEVTAPDPKADLASALERSLGPFLEAGIVELDRTADHARIRFAPKLSFTPGSGVRLPEIEEVSAALAPVLVSVPSGIQVVGHTDDIPPGPRAEYPTNQALSVARAQAVADALAVRLPADTIVLVEGRGAREPRASNASAEGREANRRVEILIPWPETR